MVKVSASNLWFIVTIIPNDIHAEIICVTGTSIIVATSLTVTNSVTFSNLLSASCKAWSSSVFWRWTSLFSLLYFAPLPFEDLPWSFSKVSRTCFCTSASLGSSFGVWAGFFRPPLLFWFPPRPLPFAGPLLILRRLLLFSLSVLVVSFFFFSGFLNWVKSIFSPVILGPSNFLYWVTTFSESAGFVSESLSSFLAGVSSLTEVVFSSCFFVVEISFFTGAETSFVTGLDSSTLDAFTSSISTLLAIVSSFTGAETSFLACLLFSSLGLGALTSRSIFPRVFGPSSLTSAFINFLEASIFFCFSSSSRSEAIRISSFSFLFSSPTSLEATFLLLSVWNYSNSTWYSSPEIFVVGRDSTS